MASAMIGTIPVSLSGLLAFYGIGPMVMTYFGHSLVQDYRDPSRVSLLNGQMFLCGDKQMVRVVNGPGGFGGSPRDRGQVLSLSRGVCCGFSRYGPCGRRFQRRRGAPGGQGLAGGPFRADGVVKRAPGGDNRRKDRPFRPALFVWGRVLDVSLFFFQFIREICPREDLSCEEDEEQDGGGSRHDHGPGGIVRKDEDEGSQGGKSGRDDGPPTGIGVVFIFGHAVGREGCHQGQDQEIQKGPGCCAACVFDGGTVRLFKVPGRFGSRRGLIRDVREILRRFRGIGRCRRGFAASCGPPVWAGGVLAAVIRIRVTGRTGGAAGIIGFKPVCSFLRVRLLGSS